MVDVNLLHQASVGVIDFHTIGFTTGDHGKHLTHHLRLDGIGGIESVETVAHIFGNVLPHVLVIKLIEFFAGPGIEDVSDVFGVDDFGRLIKVHMREHRGGVTVSEFHINEIIRRINRDNRALRLTVGIVIHREILDGDVLTAINKNAMSIGITHQ